MTRMRNRLIVGCGSRQSRTVSAEFWLISLSFFALNSNTLKYLINGHMNSVGFSIGRYNQQYYKVKELIGNLTWKLSKFAISTLWKTMKIVKSYLIMTFQNGLIYEHSGKSANIVDKNQNLISEHVCLLNTWEYTTSQGHRSLQQKGMCTHFCHQTISQTILTSSWFLTGNLWLFKKSYAVFKNR